MRKVRSSASRRAWYERHKAAHPEKHRDWRLRARYGVTAAQVDQLRAAQGNRCAICAQTLELVVDHDHARHIARGLLCRACNLLIGYAHEDVRVLEAAIEYLNDHDPAFGGCADSRRDRACG